MKKLIIISTIFVCASLYVLIGTYMWYHQDAVYEADYSKYKSEKAEFDKIQDSLVGIQHQIFYNEWILKNDTTVRTIKKIKKKPNYGELGYYKKTDKLRCSKERFSDDFVCEPIKEWVTTDYYIESYSPDTIWTEGYKKRDEWIDKVNNYAKIEAEKTRLHFKRYDGHEYHYLLKSPASSSKTQFLFFIYVLCYPIILICFIEMIIVIIEILKNKIMKQKDVENNKKVLLFYIKDFLYNHGIDDELNFEEAKSKLNELKLTNEFIKSLDTEYKINIAKNLLK